MGWGLLASMLTSVIISGTQSTDVFGMSTQLFLLTNQKFDSCTLVSFVLFRHQWKSGISLIPYCASGCFCFRESGKSGWMQDLPPLLWWPGPPACTDWEGAGQTPPGHYHPEREETGQTVRRQKTKFKMLKVCEIEGAMQTKGFKCVCQLSGPWDLPAGIREIRLRYALKLAEMLRRGKLHQEDKYRENGIFELRVLNKWYIF